LGQFRISDGLLLPAEKILVHRELKRVYAFCQTGNMTSLRFLFEMLEHEAFEDEPASGSPTRARRELRIGLLRQLLAWATHADELAALHSQDRELLDKVHTYILEMLRTLNNSSNQVSSGEEAALGWRVLIVGWERFCRSTSQQISTLNLALEASAPNERRDSSPLNDGHFSTRQLKRNGRKEPKDGALA
jgi:hypothetical protein